MGRSSLRAANLCRDVLKFLIGAAIDRMMVGTLVGSDFPPAPTPFHSLFYGLSYAWYAAAAAAALTASGAFEADGFYEAAERIGPMGIPPQLSFRMARSVSLT